MVQALITINAVAGSDDDLPINTLVQLNNTGNGGELTYAWSILYQPPGAADALSSAVIQNPTFTPKKEGTYLIQLIVNQGLGTEVTNQVIAGIRQLKTFKRVPAVGETVEANATTGWAEPAVNEQLRELDALKADPGFLVAQVNYVGPLLGDIVYFTGVATLKSGLPGEEKIIQAVEALATSSSQMAQTLGYIASTVDGGALANGDLANIRTNGLITNIALAGVLGNPVYVSNTGVLSLTAGTITRRVGVIVRASGGTIDVMFNGSDATAVSLQDAYDGGNTIVVGVSPVAVSQTVDASLLNLTNDTAGASAPQLQIEGKSLTRQGMLINLIQYGSAEAIAIADNAATKLKIWMDGLRGRVALAIKPDIPVAAGTSGYALGLQGGDASGGGGGGQKGGGVTIRGGASIATGGDAGDVNILGGDQNGGAGGHGAITLGSATTRDVQVGGGGGSGGVPFSIFQASAAPAALTDAVRPYVINESPANIPTMFLKDEVARAWRLMGGEAKLLNSGASPYTLLTTDVGVRIDSSGGAVTLNLPTLANSAGMLPIPIFISSPRTNNISIVRGAGGDLINGVAATLVIGAADPDLGGVALGPQTLMLLLSRSDTSWIITGLPAISGQPNVQSILMSMYDGQLGKRTSWQRVYAETFKGLIENKLFGAASGAGSSVNNGTASSAGLGVGVLTTGTTTTGYARWYSYINWWYDNAGDYCVQDFVGRLVDTPTAGEDFTVRCVGLGLPTGAESGFGLSIDRTVSTTNWLRSKWNAGAATQVDTGIAFSTNRFRARSVYDRAADSVEFFIDGASAGVVSTIAAISAEYVVAAEIRKVAGTTTRQMHGEYASCDVKYTTARPG